ncbi:MAG: 2-oxo acid dehydrogenase subunit E2, partial [Candidatus Limnocylindria bacterium]
MPPRDPSDTSRLSVALDGVNAGYVAQQYELYRRDPSSVDREWRVLFDSGVAGFEPAGGDRPPPAARSEGNGSVSDAQPAATAFPDGATLIRGPAARLASNMTASLAVPTATSFRDVDVAVLEDRRQELNAQLAPRKVSFTHLIGWAIVRAASDQPGMTHYFLEADGAAHRVDPGSVNLGLAVDVERADGGRFLVVPVIRGADAMDFGEFHARYEELVAGARANRLSPD